MNANLRLARRRFRPTVERFEERVVPATLPPGFTEAAIATGLSSATAMEIAPDGRLWVLEQTGRAKVFNEGSTTGFTALTIPSAAISSSGERGLLGLAFDPSYNINDAAPDYIYLYYTSTTTPNLHNRVSRFTVNNTNPDQPTLGSEQVIFELDALSSATNHNGGAIHFGPDGKLYIAVGDNATGSNAQSLNTLHGKMLRINADGSIPTDNPFYTQTTNNNRAIWALGLRNPFTFTFQPGTGRMHINDVGQNTWEEINVGAAGANYGWPGTEGDFTQSSFPSFTRPLYAYRHGSNPDQGYAITGGAFYNPSNPGANRFPTEYNGDYFYADFVSDWIRVLDVSTGVTSGFATGALGTVDLRVDAQGRLLYLARDSQSVFRVLYTGNQAPNITQGPANQTVPTNGNASFTVSATGTAPLSYQWQRAEAGTLSFANIGGATSATLNLSNAQASDNGDRFRVVVSNSFGSATSGFATLTVTANQAPTATININSGLTNGKFIAGQAINFSGTATDPEDGTLGASAFSWRVDYITSINSGTPVERPFVAQFGNQTSSSFTPATTGPYTLTDVAYRIVLTVTDSNGLSTTTTRTLSPNVATLTVATNPTGLTVTVDGQPFTAPRTFDSVVGFQRPIGAAATQTSGNNTYQFVSWSDGGAATHTISTPSTNTTYTATYQVVPSTFVARVNFQDTTSAGYSGYVADTGLVFGNRGNGLTYGWNLANNNARNRNAANSPDERYDTFNHLQKSSNPNAVWDLAVPNGSYLVRVVAGDPGFFDSVFRINVEGVLALSATPTSANRWAENTVTVNVTDGRLTISNGAGASNNKIAFIEVSSATPTVQAYQQDSGANGLVVIEAENFDASVSQGGKSWAPYTVSGYSGTGALQATPNTGTLIDTNYVSTSPRLDYRINFVKTGVHYVWIRGRGLNGNDDSIHVGLDGQALASADRISSLGTAYSWTRSTMDGVVATINVTTTGVHTLNLWMREDGTVVDKILLTTNSAYTPSSTGPAQSPRVSVPQSGAQTASLQSAPLSSPTTSAPTVSSQTTVSASKAKPDPSWQEKAAARLQKLKTALGSLRHSLISG